MPSARIVLRSLTILLALCSTSTAQAPRPYAQLFHALPAGGQAGKSVDVVVSGTDLDAADGLWFSDSGIVATPVTGKPKTFRVTIAAGTAIGAVDVRAITPDGVSNPRLFVVGTYPESAESEPNQTPETANSVEINSVVNGSVLPTDVDCFAIQGKKGQRIFIGLAAERIESKLDATVRLVDDRGVELAESRDAHGADPFLDVTLPADGRYVVKVHDVTYEGSPEHFYRLTIDDGPHLDAVFPAIGEPGKAGRYTLIGRNIGGSPLPDLGSDGRPINARTIEITPTFVPSTELRVELVRSAAGLIGQTISEDGSNPVLLTDAGGPVVVEHEPNAIESPQSVVPPCAIAADFRVPGDVDAYRFVAKKGDVWRIEAIAEAIGSPADPTFTIQRVPDKGLPTDLSTADDTPDPGLSPRFNLASVDATIRWTVPEDGTYQVVVNDVAGNSRGGPELYYKLLIRRERPSFQLFVVPQAPNVLDSVTVRRGGRASAVVLARRLDGFNGPIRVVPIGLPTGLICEPVIIPVGQVSATIVFEAEGNAKPTVGIVRLEGFGAMLDEPRPKDGFHPDSWIGFDRRAVAIPGSAIWPPVIIPNAPRPPVSDVRASRGLVVAIRDGSPFLLTARPRRPVVAVGQAIDVDLTVKRGPGFDDAVTLATPDLPTGFTPPTGVIAKGTNDLRVSMPGLKATPGLYSLVVRGTGTIKLGPDPKKPGFKVDEPSNTFIVDVRPAPIALTLVSKPPTLKPGGSALVEVKIERKGTFKGAVSLNVDAPPLSNVRSDWMMIGLNQTTLKFPIRAETDAPVGTVATTLRAEAVVDGELIEIALPLPVIVQKP